MCWTGSAAARYAPSQRSARARSDRPGDVQSQARARNPSVPAGIHLCAAPVVCHDLNESQEQGAPGWSESAAHLRQVLLVVLLGIVPLSRREDLRRGRITGSSDQAARSSRAARLCPRGDSALERAPRWRWCGRCAPPPSCATPRRSRAARRRGSRSLREHAPAQGASASWHRTGVFPAEAWRKDRRESAPVRYWVPQSLPCPLTWVGSMRVQSSSQSASKDTCFCGRAQGRRAGTAVSPAHAQFPAETRGLETSGGGGPAAPGAHRVILHEDRLGVARAPGADLIVRRVGGLALGVPDERLGDARDALVGELDAPEAPCGEREGRGGGRGGVRGEGGGVGVAVEAEAAVRGGQVGH